MENTTDDGAALPIHALFSVAGDTPETDAKSGWKIRIAYDDGHRVRTVHRLETFSQVYRVACLSGDCGVETPVLPSAMDAADRWNHQDQRRHSVR